MSNFGEIAVAIAATVQTKQGAYGDSFGKSGAVMKILYPNGIGPEQLDDSLTVVRILDKLFRIATDRDALGESPYGDIAGYCLLALKRLEGTTMRAVTLTQGPDSSAVEDRLRTSTAIGAE